MVECLKVRSLSAEARNIHHHERDHCTYNFYNVIIIIVIMQQVCQFRFRVLILCLLPFPKETNATITYRIKCIIILPLSQVISILTSNEEKI